MKQKLSGLLQHMSFLGFIFAIVLTMGAIKTNDQTIYSAKTSADKKERMSPKPVHTLFSTVKTLDELQEKLKQAKNENKPVMIEFYAAWCPSCQALDTHVFSTLEIQQLMRPFSNIRVDLTKKTDDLMQIVMYYQVYGTPSFIFYDKNGDEFNTDRFKDVSELKEVLRKLGK